MNISPLVLTIVPSLDSVWFGPYFSQQTRFQYNGKHVTLSAIFHLEEIDQFSQRAIENLWQEITTTAFTHRALQGEQLIERILKVANDGLIDLPNLVGGAILTIEDSTVHFSSTGNIGVYLKSESDTTKVSSEDGSTNKFAAVTSGPLESVDSLIITCNAFQSIVAHDQSPESLEESMRDHQALAIWIHQHHKEVAEKGRAESRIATSIFPRIKSISATVITTIRKIPRPKLKLPQIKVGKIRLKLGSVISVVLFIGLVGAIIYGGALVKKQISKVKTPPAPAETLLTKLNAVSTDQTAQFLLSSYNSESYNSLSQADQSSFIQLLQSRAITAIKPETVQEFPENIVSADLLNGKIYAVDSTGQLWKYDGQTLSKVQQNGLIINPKQLLSVKDDRILVTDDSGNIWLFDFGATQPVSLALPKEVSVGKKLLARYQNNLYIYHESDQTIYRVSNYDREITGISTYAKLSAVGITDVVDLKIYGDAVAISSTGSVQLFRKSQKQGAAFSYSVTPQPYQLLVSDNGAEVTITGNRFITAYTTSGVISSERFALTDSPITIGLLQNNTVQYLICGKKLLAVR